MVDSQMALQALWILFQTFPGAMNLIDKFFFPNENQKKMRLDA